MPGKLAVGRVFSHFCHALPVKCLSLRIDSMIEGMALSKWIAAAVGAAAAGVLVLGGEAAVAQARQPSQTEPNVLERIGNWFDRSFGSLDEDMKQRLSDVERLGDRGRDAVKRAAADAAASASQMSPRVRIINERHRCEPAANGAPDCQQAAEAACRRNGYAKGSSLQSQSEQKCALPRLFSETSIKCHTETHILRALCQ
jgi:hypothetical protein